MSFRYSYSNSSYGNHYIKYGRIVKTHIDQGFAPIINVPTPINPGDAVPKEYVDNLLDGGTTDPKINFNLNGTSSTPIVLDTTGIMSICVSPVINDGPMAIFDVIKTDISIPGQVNRRISAEGKTTHEKLKITWPANEGIFVNKTDVNYDGGYCAVLKYGNSISSDPKINFNLNGTSSTPIILDTTGIMSICVSSLINDGPMAIFDVIKTDISIPGQVNRRISAEGKTTHEKLKITWPPNQGIFVNKTDINYDGGYCAVLK